MKKTRFTETQIVSILNKHEQGKAVRDIWCEHVVNDAKFYNWKGKYGGVAVNDLKRMKEQEEENSRLKRIVANLMLENDALKHGIEKNSMALRQTGSSKDSGRGKAHQCTAALEDRKATPVFCILSQKA